MVIQAKAVPIIPIPLLVCINYHSYSFSEKLWKKLTKVEVVYQNKIRWKQNGVYQTLCKITQNRVKGLRSDKVLYRHILDKNNEHQGPTILGGINYKEYKV
jgi:hypothetical protein